MNCQKMQSQPRLQTVEFPLDWAKGEDLTICPVCDIEFQAASKMAIVMPTGGMVGWACLKCSSRFDFNNNLIQLRLPGFMFAGGIAV